MDVNEPVHLRAWRAELALGYERRSGRTVLATRHHDGPLMVQKALYPEGDAVCHSIVLHPPAGIAGGDELDIRIHAADDAQVLLTTPGATKWYRTSGAWAQQRVAITVDNGAGVEWLPQESIVFDQALAHNAVDVRLTGKATYLGWDVVCLGRAGSGEQFARGAYQTQTCLTRDGKPLWFERGHIGGSSGRGDGGVLRTSPAGLGGATVCATLLAASTTVDAAHVQACRAVETPRHAAVTRLPGLLIARYLGDSGAEARHYFTRLWRVLRPALTGRDMVEPRIWST